MLQICLHALGGTAPNVSLNTTVVADATITSPVSTSTAVAPTRPWDTATSQYGGAYSSYGNNGTYGSTYGSSPYGSQYGSGSMYGRPAGSLFTSDGSVLACLDPAFLMWAAEHRIRRPGMAFGAESGIWPMISDKS